MDTITADDIVRANPMVDKDVVAAYASLKQALESNGVPLIVGSQYSVAPPLSGRSAFADHNRSQSRTLAHKNDEAV